MEKFKHFLQSIAPISDVEFAYSIPFFEEKFIRKGDFFVKQSNVCQHIGYIIHGTLRTFYLNDKAEETTSCFCTENNFTTSFRSFILQQPSNLSIQATDDTSLLVIEYNNLQKLYKSSNTWQNIGRIVAEQQYIEMEKYAGVLNNETAKEKYLRLLHEHPHIIQKASIEEIASYLGVTRRTLSRVRQEISKLKT